MTIVSRLIGGLIGVCLGLAPAARAEAPCGRELVVPTVVQRGPTCAVAAVVMAARGIGVDLTLESLAREVPVWTDGVDFFDIEEALGKRGVRGMTFRGDVALAARFVDAGVPVVLAVDLHGGKHAVTMAGHAADRVGGRCAATPARVRIIDPWDGRTSSRARADLERIQFGRQLFVAWPRGAGWEERIEEAGVDLGPLVVQDRRFRAEAWVRRAKQHASPNPQMLALLDRAVTEDPGWPEARALRDEVRRAIAP